MSGEKLTVTVKDSVTGEQRTLPTLFDATWWSEGNGSCDCNRHGLFFPEHPRAEPPDGLLVFESYCLGCVRYLIVDVSPMPPGWAVEDFNTGYEGPN